MLQVSHSRAMLRPLRRLFAAALAVSQAVAQAAPPGSAFAAAVAHLRQTREGSAVGTVEHRTRDNEAFFAGFDPATLGPREVAEVVRLNAFAYGDAVKVHAKVLAEKLEPLAAAPDLDGALAATLLVPLSGPGGKGPQRAGWEAAALRHPAFVGLLQSEFGDLALDVACRTAPRTEEARALFLGLAGKFDATHSIAAAGLITRYWDRLVAFVPEGAQREAIRQRLVVYLSAAQSRLAADNDQVRLREWVDRELAQLNGAEARGRFLGRPAPALNFIWSSRAGWQSLSDLRGQVVVLDFWATWCGPCVESFPEVAKLVERYRNTNVQVVGVTSLQGHFAGLGPRAIDCRNQPEKEMDLMPEYIRAKKMTWPVVFTREPVMNPDYGINGIPTTVVLAPDGTVRYKGVGYSGPKLAQAIDAVLAEFKLKAPGAE